MSYNTMERMVTDAVKGTPTTAPSRTDHFRIRSRAATPFRHADSDSSDAECSVPTTAGTDTSKTTDQGELGDSSAFGESDSAEEMALISASFKPLAETVAPIQTASTSSARDVGTAGQETDQSNPDVTLSEVREQTLSERSRSKVKSKKMAEPKQQSQRGVPMREEFFAKIGWTRSFISGPADPLHNPYTVWCHICKKKFSIRTKGTMEILRNHRTEKYLRKDQRRR